jgi:hypothetical protein
MHSNTKEQEIIRNNKQQCRQHRHMCYHRLCGALEGARDVAHIGTGGNAKYCSKFSVSKEKVIFVWPCTVIRNYKGTTIKSVCLISARHEKPNHLLHKQQ